MTYKRLHDLELITFSKWSTPHLWRELNGKVEFGMPTTFGGIEWFGCERAPVHIEKMVCEFVKNGLITISEGIDPGSEQSFEASPGTTVSPSNSQLDLHKLIVQEIQGTFEEMEKRILDKLKKSMEDYKEIK